MLWAMSTILFKNKKIEKIEKTEEEWEETKEEKLKTKILNFV